MVSTITYSTNPNDMNEANLQKFDGLLLYANYDTISAQPGKSVAQFCKRRKGLYSFALCFVLF